MLQPGAGQLLDGGDDAAARADQSAETVTDEFGAVGLNKIARFRLDPRDIRSDDDFYELIGDDDGVFGCMSLLGCHDVCPKQLPLQTQIAYMRRKMAVLGLS